MNFTRLRAALFLYHCDETNPWRMRVLAAIIGRSIHTLSLSQDRSLMAALPQVTARALMAAGPDQNDKILAELRDSFAEEFGHAFPDFATLNGSADSVAMVADMAGRIIEQVTDGVVAGWRVANILHAPRLLAEQSLTAFTFGTKFTALLEREESCLQGMFGETTFSFDYSPERQVLTFAQGKEMISFAGADGDYKLYFAKGEVTLALASSMIDEVVRFWSLEDLESGDSLMAQFA